jgi:hypothetical protein
MIFQAIMPLTLFSAPRTARNLYSEVKCRPNWPSDETYKYIVHQTYAMVNKPYPPGLYVNYPGKVSSQPPYSDP